jgi:hypothetical protein
MFNLFKKKNDGFYLQAEDNTPSVPKEKPLAKAAEVKKTEPAPVVKEVAAPPESAPKGKDDSSKPAAKVDNKEAKAPKKEKKAKKEKAAQVEAPAPAPAPASAPAPTPVAASAPAISTPRRRPGANMKSFMELAKTVEKPANIAVKK